MTDNELQQIEIQLSKIKMGLLFLSALLLVALGVLLVVCEPESINYSNRFSWIMRPVPRVLSGLLFVILFGFLGVILLIRLFNRNPGITINEKGIIDNTSFFGLGFIPWKDIKDIKTVRINNGDFILILLKNPSDYINSTTYWLKRKLLKTNFKYHYTPLCMSVNSLEINFNELHKLLVNNMEKFKK
ncbi:STM3941 family protein [Chryseobacterium sp. GP-SGM7]|uniref:STM3941 family protein n=1 Tax=Chryseobacterium sp. GP-SGM7 TaxID=3411323 RepID=UPI003B951464